MSDFYTEQIEAQQEAEEVFGLLQQAGANTDHLGYLTGKLHEAIDECGGPPSPVRTIGSSANEQRARRVTARLNYLRANFWRLPLPTGNDEPLSRMRPKLEREFHKLHAKLEAGSVSKASLRAIAIKSARELANRKAVRAH